eukprot:tig00021720_g23194.t1
MAQRALVVGGGKTRSNGKRSMSARAHYISGMALYKLGPGGCGTRSTTSSATWTSAAVRRGTRSGGGGRDAEAHRGALPASPSKKSLGSDFSTSILQLPEERAVCSSFRSAADGLLRIARASASAGVSSLAVLGPVVYAAVGGDIARMDRSDGRLLEPLAGAHTAAIQVLRTHGGALFSAGLDGCIVAWDTARGAPAYRIVPPCEAEGAAAGAAVVPLSVPSSPTRKPGRPPISDIAFAAGRMLVAFRGEEAVWEYAPVGRRPHPLSFLVPAMQWLTRAARAGAACAGAEGGGAWTRRFESPRERITCMCLLGTELLATASRSTTGREAFVRVWRLGAGAPEGEGESQGPLAEVRIRPLRRGAAQRGAERSGGGALLMAMRVGAGAGAAVGGAGGPVRGDAAGGGDDVAALALAAPALLACASRAGALRLLRTGGPGDGPGPRSGPAREWELDAGPGRLGPVTRALCRAAS